MAARPLLQVRGLRKSFGYTHALRGVDLDLFPGEVLALVGENGAGKSTLAKILAGVHRPDAGEILFDGRPVPIRDIHTARRLGIAVVHQELNLVPHLTVADNLFLGREPVVLGPIRWLDRATLRRQAQAMLDLVGLDVDPGQQLRELPLAKRQMVEIARALSERARVLLLDEPTSSLAESDAAELLRIVHDLRERGLGIIYISHRLSEVLQIADRIAVLRDGEKVGEVPASQATRATLTSMMVGRDLDTLYPKRPVQIGEEVLRVEGVLGPGLTAPVSFSVRSGEIFGIAGLVGSGRSELLRAIFGANPRTAGRVTVAGRELPAGIPAASLAHGLALVPEDRKLDGLILNMSIQDNVVLSVLHRLATYALRRRGREAQIAAEYVARVGVKLASMDEPVRLLSGGNQQKTLLAKGLACEPKVLLLDDPTRGIDVGAKHDIYELICGLAEAGVALVMVSSEMEEILGLSDRVMVMNSGRPAGLLEADELSEAAIMELAAR
ncbi:MAG: sugar ABC transporter ATP-binding protein [Armatimonadetes bacterium]|nr:sugar ABC transporter ATP-binding protein [Armatimonadota bacterium]